MNKGGTSQPQQRQLESKTVKALVVEEPTHITTIPGVSYICAVVSSATAIQLTANYQFPIPIPQSPSSSLLREADKAKSQPTDRFPPQKHAQKRAQTPRPGVLLRLSAWPSKHRTRNSLAGVNTSNEGRGRLSIPPRPRNHVQSGIAARQSSPRPPSSR
ncbi:hypothetical protein BKA56DRAFT_614965 [Ilyonectria sp. MPI-CAGE-AT-0026]|nr:hypothetical protein BKA56DRAFT_614965 [Ilyonectria sp. MPI-CAGE-AT-0026]